MDKARREAQRRERNPFVRIPHTYDPPPDGLKVYTVAEAAAVMQTTVATMYVYFSKGGNLQGTARYRRKEDRAKVYDAEPIDKYVAERRNAGWVPANKGTTFKRDPATRRALKVVKDEERFACAASDADTAKRSS
jgi:hypothetical protein